jgi:hypothetical protein
MFFEVYKCMLILSRRWGVHPLNREREEKGYLVNYCENLEAYPDRFYEYTRMTPEDFNRLFDFVSLRITKFGRKAIPPKLKLFATLR